jgi:hypothetical protein
MSQAWGRRLGVGCALGGLSPLPSLLHPMLEGWKGIGAATNQPCDIAAACGELVIRIQAAYVLGVTRTFSITMQQLGHGFRYL